MLERIVEKAAQDPAFHGEMFRLLLDSELVVIIPANQPLVQQGADTFRAENPLVVSRFADAKGPFYPIFTSETAAERKMSSFPNVAEFRIAALNATVALQLVCDGQTPVRLISQGPANFYFPPEAIPEILAGNLSDANPDEGESTTMSLLPVDADSLPEDLVEAIRKFCDSRPVALGVYAFLAKKPEAKEWDSGTIHFFLWLRDTDRSFYNDFSLLARSYRKGLQIGVNVAGPEEIASFLESAIPLWPYLAGGAPTD